MNDKRYRHGLELRDQVKIKSQWKPLNGKVGTVTNKDKWQCDVKVDGKTYLLHVDQLTKLNQSS